MRILFVIDELDFADHISISYLSAVSRYIGWSTYFIYLSGKGSNNLISKISDIKPDVVAYSVNIMSFEKIIKEHKKAKVLHQFISIMGGPQTTFSPETFEESGVDCYCVGEGELVLKDFLKAVEERKPFDNIPNIIARDNDGNIKINPVRPLLTEEELNNMPMPDRDLTISNSFLKNISKKTFYTTRGCWYSCSYCCNNIYNMMFKGKGQIVRRFNVERILKEIENVKSKYKCDFIKFGDDLFALKADEWLVEFSEKYPSRIGIPFNCVLRFDIVNDEILKLLKIAGCYSVTLSVDSISDHIRECILKRRMKKDVDIAGQLKKIKSYDIKTFVNFMLAVPESTLEDDINTIKLARECDITYTGYTTTVPIKGTELYRYCIDKGIIDPKLYKGDTSFFERSILPCFIDKDKDIRYNILLLGAIVSKLPWEFYNIGIWTVKNIHPNILFRYIYENYKKYSYENEIFKLKS